MRQERRDRRPLIASILIAGGIAIVIIAQRDLHTRPPSQIRGSRPIWQLASLNAIGAIAYLARGRRPHAPPLGDEAK